MNQNFIFSCSRCSCTIFILTSDYLYTQVALILVLLMFNIYRMLFLALKKVSPPDEKIPVLTKISHPPPPTERGDFSPYPFNAI